ncbi:MAG: cyclophilin-like family protein [Nitrososphaeraceae archaeon]
MSISTYFHQYSVMKKIIAVVFPDLDEVIRIELDDSLAPKTFKAIFENLPIEVNINRWGDELYTDRTMVSVGPEDNAKTEVNKLDVAYWPEGKALCLFFGPTPISKDERILAYSPVNILGRIIDSDKDEILSQIKNGAKVIIKG